MSEKKEADEGTAKLAAAIEGLVSKHGGEQGAIKTLLDENLKYRDRIRDLKKDLETAKATAAPDGALILTGDELKAYEALKAIGDASSISEKLKAGEAAQHEVATYRRSEARAKAAKAAKANADVLATIGAGLDYAIEGEGEEAKVFVVTPPDDGGTDGDKTPFWEYVDANWPALKGALTQGDAPPQPQQPRFPAQPPLSQRTPAGPMSTDEILKQKKMRGEFSL